MMLPCRQNTCAQVGCQLYVVVVAQSVCLHALLGELPYWFKVNHSVAIYHELQYINVQSGREHVKSVVAVARPGKQQVSAVHLDDVAEAYLAALDHGAAGIYNVVGEQGITQQQVADAVSQKLSTAKSVLPVRNVTLEDATSIYSAALAWPFSINNDVDNSKAQRELHWKPKHTSGFTAVVASAN